MAWQHQTANRGCREPELITPRSNRAAKRMRARAAADQAGGAFGRIVMPAEGGLIRALVRLQGRL
jgi:hypothetical protein